MNLTIGFYIDSVEFTPAVIAGTASLGGSESACLGLARALQARGHDVYIFTPKLHPEAPAVDYAGVRWNQVQDLDGMTRVIDWDVFVSLRMPNIFDAPVRAKFRVLWSEDLMYGAGMKNHVMGSAWAYDAVAYVSEYHRRQWEALVPELAPIGYVTRNGFDPAYVPAAAVKNPDQIIHISRPERGLAPILAMWPELRKRYPAAQLKLCRYSSMYDKDGWGKVCESYDVAVRQMNEQVGGIEYLGELGKPALYQAIAESAVMWYPGVHDFGETSCIAAIESQACGTPFVGSWKGALPETCPSGLYVKGNAAEDSAYHEASISAVIGLLQDAKRQGRRYRELQRAGLAHVSPAYSYGAIAAEWEGWLLAQFDARAAAYPLQVVDRLLHEDDHVAAKVLAAQLLAEGRHQDRAAAVLAFCEQVIDGKHQTAEEYAEAALDPRAEIQHNPRIPHVCTALKDATSILDLACGNGTFAIALAQANPACHVVGVDYAQGNVDVARAAAIELGVGDRCTFVCAPAYDFETHEPATGLSALIAEHGPFDGVFVGEFLEHIANVQGFLLAVHGAVSPGARMVCTMPAGPFGELVPKDVPHRRGHVHHYRPEDLLAIFGGQDDLSTEYLEAGVTPRGSLIGNWLVAYRVNPAAAVEDRPIAKRLRTIRPKLGLTVGILANDTTDLRRCLAPVWQVADEILIGDTGAKPSDLAAIVAEYRRVRVVPVGPVPTLKGGFSEARNTVLAEATGDWFCWIDTDEVLVGAEGLHKYLEGGVFNGYAIKQNHLMLDTPMTFDTPVRVFRKQAAIQFYGCIHEQPQLGDCNGDIVPALQINDVQIAHTLGYLTERTRRQKCLERNMPLLIRDAQVFPDRVLGKVLILRDFVNLATWDREGHGGALTPKAKAYYQKAIAIFEQHFLDPTHKYHQIGRPFYEAALQRVSGAREVEIAFGTEENGMRGRAKAQRFWVRTTEHLQTMLDFLQKQWLKALQPVVLDVEPIVPFTEPKPALTLVETPDVEGAPV